MELGRCPADRTTLILPFQQQHQSTHIQSTLCWRITGRRDRGIFDSNIHRNFLITKIIRNLYPRNNINITKGDGLSRHFIQFLFHWQFSRPLFPGQIISSVSLSLPDSALSFVSACTSVLCASPNSPICLLPQPGAQPILHLLLQGFCFQPLYAAPVPTSSLAVPISA